MKSAILIGMFILFNCYAPAQKTFTANTLKLDSSVQRTSYSVKDVAWIEGKWKDVEDSTIMEEHWMRPEGNSMLGMFRMRQAGRPVFYELMTLFEEKNSVTLRLKHFYRNMKGWEHKDSTGVSFPLIKVEGKKAFFDGQTYQLTSDDTLVVFLAESNRRGEVKEEIFRFKRVK